MKNSPSVRHQNIFGKFMQRRSKELGVGVYLLAKRNGVDTRWAWRWEKGFELPPVSQIRALSKMFKTSDKKLRRLLVEAEMRGILDKYGFFSAADPDKFEIKIISKRGER